MNRNMDDIECMELYEKMLADGIDYELLPNLLMINGGKGLIRNLAQAVYRLIEKKRLYRRHLEHKFVELRVPDTNSSHVICAFLEEMDRACMFQNISYGVYLLDMSGEYSRELLEILMEYIVVNYESKKFVVYCTEQSVEDILRERIPFLVVEARTRPYEYVQKRLRNNSIDMPDVIIEKIVEILSNKTENEWNDLWKNIMIVLYRSRNEEEKILSLKELLNEEERRKIGFRK